MLTARTVCSEVCSLLVTMEKNTLKITIWMLNSFSKDILDWDNIFWEKNDHVGCHFAAFYELWLQCAAEEV